MSALDSDPTGVSARDTSSPGTKSRVMKGRGAVLSPVSRSLSVAVIAALALSACSSNSEENESSGSEPAAVGGIEIQDDHGTHTLPEEITSVVATDNRSFRTLEAFGVELTAAPLGLARETSYAENESILDLGSHREPDLQNIIAAEPDLIINGQRFASFYDDIVSLTEDAGYDTVTLEFEPSEDPAEFADGLITKTEKLGEVFGEEEAAEAIVDEFNAQVQRVQDAYDGESTAMGLLTSGGTISFVAPGSGRSIGPLFPLFDLEPALEMEGEDESHGDDISVEAIAEANPEWLFVMDRDATIASDEEEYRPARELIEDSEALQNVPAVRDGNVVYLPDNFYLTEDIQAYTELFSDIADSFEAAQSS